MKKIENNTGITLIALVITIIVLVILAGVSIAMLTANNGILIQARKAKEETERAAKEEKEILNEIENYLTIDNEYNSTKGVNEPKILPGMKKIMFTLPEGNNKGKVIKQEEKEFDSDNWYNYKESKWANAQTEDGSMWVWIPRYAYKITYNDKNDKSKGGKIDIKFLIGTSDEYYTENGIKKTAKRTKSVAEEADTTTDYYVHPAFANESNINYANGGWDKELTGIWVAKFEAGYATGNNIAPKKESSVKYSQTTGWVAGGEVGSETDDTQPARNWLDGVYGEKETAIKYPTFQPKTYSMNYININDSYNISRALTEEGNIYGLNSSVDSHLMKNSEWGAVSYLSHSKYGTNGIEPYVNNITLENSITTIYAVTGVTTGSIDKEEQPTTIEKVNGTRGNIANDGVYTWDQIEGEKASTTRNMYGIYDFNGGLFERTTGYIANAHDSLKEYGETIAYDGDKLKTKSTKYTTVYPHVQEDASDYLGTCEKNYLANKRIYGDAIRETSTDGVGQTAWNNDYLNFPAIHYPFTVRGCDYCDNSRAGLFSLYYNDGNNIYDHGFRSVLVA